ncbi:DUF6603 domain-containing protein [Spirillospora sp. CA-255316]
MLEESSQTMTMGAMKQWLTALSDGTSLAIPSGLPDQLGEVRDAINPSALVDWFPVLNDVPELVEISVDHSALTDLSVEGRLKGKDLSLRVRFLADSDDPKDGDPVAGAVLSLSLKDVEGFGFLSEVLKTISLDFEIRRIDGGTRRALAASTTLQLSADRKLTISAELDFAALTKSHTFTATSDRPISVADALEALGWSGAQSLAFLPSFTGIALGYDALDQNKRRIVLYPTGSVEGTLTWAAAVLPKEDGESGRPVVASAMVPFGSKTKLSDLDLLRGQIPADADVQVGLQAVYTSQKLGKARIQDLNAAIGGSGAPVPDAEDLEAGITLAAWVSIGSKTYKLLLRKPQPQQAVLPAVPGGGELAQGQDGDGSEVTLKVERALGPLHLRQVRVRLLPAAGGSADRLVVGLDAAFSAAGFELEASGLGLEIELKETPAVSVVLRALGVAYARDPLYLMGALAQRPPDDRFNFAYDGLIMVRTANWGFLAVGSYARLKKTDQYPAYTSLFVFGALEGQIAGPPPVVFTGLALGFGYNSKVGLPEADKVPDFPFVRALGDMQDLTGAAPGQPVDPITVLDKISGGTDAAVVPANGVMWLAAGLACSIAEIVDVRALLMVQFGGDDFVAALLGTISADFPARSAGSSEAPSIAHLELGFRALYEHSKRQFSLTAALSDNSWLVHKECKLTGGAALYLWFPGSEHEGDFVATVGGYHPAFRKPDHYPSVPRLGLSWSVSSVVAVKGELYVAVTPKAGMVGGRLEVTYDAGGLRAWLIAYFNVIVWWAPLYFEAEIGITIGASYTLDLWLFSVTVRVEIGATLNVWGPPTGGRAHLKVGPFSVTIGFGEPEKQLGPAMSWKEFNAKQLPKAPVTVSAQDGLLTDPVKAKDATADRWLVSTDGFAFTTRTTIPATEVRYGGAAQDLDDRPSIGGRERDRKKQFDVRPMRYTGSASAPSTHTVTISNQTRAGFADTDLSVDTGHWTVTPLYAAVPDALWGVPIDTPPSPDTTADQPTAVYANGLDVRMPPPKLDGNQRDTSIDVLKDVPWTGKVNPLSHGAPHQAPGGPGVDKPTAFARMEQTLTALSLLEVLP